MIDYSNYLATNTKTFEAAQESISFAPIVLSRKLLILSSIFLLLILLNVVVALRVSILSYNINDQGRVLKSLQVDKAVLLSKVDHNQGSDRELQEAIKLGLKPINTDQIRFYQ